jgi:general secretion pathway protein A
MYLDYFHLHLKPFQISTDPKFLWLGEKHREALAVLKYGVVDNKGFLLLTGNVGTGKTTLLNALVNSLGEDVHVAMVADPSLEKMDFFNFVAHSFGMGKKFQSKGEFLIHLKNYLIELNQRGKQALLIIDECQRLSPMLLEEVRLLSNIERTDTKLINIFFVGQSEFNNIILSHQNRALRQRITVNYNIDALSEAETEDYIGFRLRVAGAEDNIFTSDAINEVYQFSNGYPRLINIICDQSLLTGFVKEKHHIDEKIVAECANELKIEAVPHSEDNLAIPEARPHKKEEAPQKKEVVATWLQGQLLNKPLMIALVVVLILLFGLMATFVFNRQPSGATLNAVDKNTNDQDKLHTVSSGEMSDRAPNQETIGRDTKEGEEQPPTTEGEAAVRVAPTRLGNAELNISPEVTERVAEKPITLNEIRAKYGIYPEVHFGLNSNNLDNSAYEVLGEIAQYCVQNPEVILVLRGYTDRSGVLDYNLKLSGFRSNMAKSYLVGKGVRNEAITVMSIGPGDEGPGGTKVPYDGRRRKVVIEIISPNG